MALPHSHDTLQLKDQGISFIYTLVHKHNGDLKSLGLIRSQDWKLIPFICWLHPRPLSYDKSLLKLHSPLTLLSHRSIWAALCLFWLLGLAADVHRQSAKCLTKQERGVKALIYLQPVLPSRRFSRIGLLLDCCWGLFFYSTG